MDVSDEVFRDRLVAELNQNEGFVRETRWFDGAILLEVGPGQCWLKVYRGRVIDAMPFAPPLGYTFKISGPVGPWVQLVRGERKLVDLITPGSRYFADENEVALASSTTPPRIRIEGNTFEAGRIHEAIHHLGDSLVAAASQE